MKEARTMSPSLAPAYANLGLVIGGDWIEAADRRTTRVVNPATEEVIGEIPHASAADLDRALAAAEAGFRAWRAIFPDQRGKILKKTADILRSRSEELARTATIESGKRIAETRVEVAMAAAIFEWYAEEGRRAYGRVLPQRAPGTRHAVVKEPVGPVAAFAAWNFPLGNPARKLGATLGAGCSCILKPAEETPASALGIARALTEAGVPAGVFSIVFGVPAEVSSHLLASPVVRAISFTGSVAVGKHLMKLAADGMKRTTLELGGHAPVLVFEDTDLDSVLDASISAKYRNAGQVCVSPTRFYVHESIYNRFVDGFAARAKAILVGDGLVESNQMGPLIHDRRLKAMEEFTEDATHTGGRVHAGGERLRGSGYFWRPTVLSDVPRTARIMNEEPFGPIAVINPFTDFEMAINEANRLPYGLAAYAFTRSARTVKLLGENLEAGMVGLNTYAISLPESPFGGVKESGHGSEEGIEGLESCLVTKFISEA
jgi:succinate-semialdehyde dehydrogenase/glutarate-semialdehyde dehydrogenase